MKIKSLHNFIVVCIIVLALVILFTPIGCMVRRSVIKAPSEEVGVCPPDAKFCEAPTQQRYEITKNSNVFVQIAEPIEVIALIHKPDYREPTQATVWLDKGTWAVPERLLTVQEAEERSTTTDYKFQLTEVP